jgi:2-amino-4-hydroxy-6-hydroxymethyldihydropteridine diphosphokinase
MPHALIGLGSNLGDRADILDAALSQLANHPGIQLIAKSRWHHTAPVGGPAGQGEFLNGAAHLETTLSPENLLRELLAIERSLGRERTVRWSARPIDLDLLLYDRLVVDSPPLQIPHPRMSFRRFVLAPAVEIAPQMAHPANQWTIDQLWNHLNTAANYVALTGGSTGLRRELVKKLSDNIGIRHVSHPASTTVRSRDNALELCRRGAQALHGAIDSDKNTWTVSEFWFDALPDAWGLSTAEAVRFNRCPEFVKLRSTVAKPKLLLLFESSSRPETELREKVFHPDCGPALVLDADDQDSALVEMTAAIEAMMG